MLRDLLKYEHHVVLGEQSIQRQRKLVADHISNGREATRAKAILHQLETMQALHVMDRDQCRQAYITATEP